MAHTCKVCGEILSKEYSDIGLCEKHLDIAEEDVYDDCIQYDVDQQCFFMYEDNDGDY